MTTFVYQAWIGPFWNFLIFYSRSLRPTEPWRIRPTPPLWFLPSPAHLLSDTLEYQLLCTSPNSSGLFPPQGLHTLGLIPWQRLWPTDVHLVPPPSPSQATCMSFSLIFLFSCLFWNCMSISCPKQNKSSKYSILNTLCLPFDAFFIDFCCCFCACYTHTHQKVWFLITFFHLLFHYRVLLSTSNVSSMKAGVLFVCFYFIDCQILNI